MHRTKIEYLQYCWNPTAGCSGKGCACIKKCWAYRMAKRLGRYCEVCPSFRPHVHWDRNEEPLLLKKPSLIGVSFMGDFYDDGIAPWVRWTIYDIMERTDHTYVVLTKQPQNIDEHTPPNLWIGVSVNKKADLWRISSLRHTNAALKIASFEPLYNDLEGLNLKGFRWVIIGAQTRPELQPKRKWVLKTMNEAKRNNCAIFLKNNLNIGRFTFSNNGYIACVIPGVLLPQPIRQTPMLWM